MELKQSVGNMAAQLIVYTMADCSACLLHSCDKRNRPLEEAAQGCWRADLRRENRAGRHGAARCNGCEGTAAGATASQPHATAAIRRPCATMPFLRLSTTGVHPQPPPCAGLLEGKKIRGDRHDRCGLAVYCAHQTVSANANGLLSHAACHDLITPVHYLDPKGP